MKVTVKQLIQDLQNYNPDSEMYFGGLEFYRLKERGESVHLEFNQTVYQDSDGKVIIQNL